MNDDELLRYSRQIMLPQLDVAGQEKLLAGRVLVVGLGGLGCPAAMYLASAGVGHLVLADPDEVELSNLQRQIAHHGADIGMNKAESAAHTLHALNPGVRVEVLPLRLEGESLDGAVRGADVVLDCTDNFDARIAINRSCRRHRVPLVSGAAIRMEAQLVVFDHRKADSPCYQCLYGGDAGPQLSCSESGVMAPLVGIVGAMQAMEAIKLLAGIGDDRGCILLALDAVNMQWREMKLARDPHCPVCGMMPGQ